MRVPTGVVDSTCMTIKVLKTGHQTLRTSCMINEMDYLIFTSFLKHGVLDSITDYKFDDWNLAYFIIRLNGSIPSGRSNSPAARHIT